MKLISIDQISDEVITIRWDDGHESLFFAEHLRINGPCDVCNNDPPHKESIKKSGKIKFSGWKLAGRYAVEFHFNDGHTSGIYPYELLRDLCKCDQCSGDVTTIQGPFRA